MTVGGILAAVDGVKPNRFDRAQKFVDNEVLKDSDLGKYQNSMQLYNASYLSFMDWYNRTHMPKQRVTHFRL